MVITRSFFTPVFLKAEQYPKFFIRLMSLLTPHPINTVPAPYTNYFRPLKTKNYNPGDLMFMLCDASPPSKAHVTGL